MSTSPPSRLPTPAVVRRRALKAQLEDLEEISHCDCGGTRDHLHSPTCAYYLRTLLLSGQPLPSYASLARKISRSRHHTRRVVLGMGNPSREMFELVAGACGLSLDELKQVQEERLRKLAG